MVAEKGCIQVGTRAYATMDHDKLSAMTDLLPIVTLENPDNLQRHRKQPGRAKAMS